jgi:hypothetical protein
MHSRVGPDHYLKYIENIFARGSQYYLPPFAEILLYQSVKYPMDLLFIYSNPITSKIKPVPQDCLNQLINSLACSSIAFVKLTSNTNQLHHLSGRSSTHIFNNNLIGVMFFTLVRYGGILLMTIPCPLPFKYTYFESTCWNVFKHNFIRPFSNDFW